MKKTHVAMTHEDADAPEKEKHLAQLILNYFLTANLPHPPLRHAYVKFKAATILLAHVQI